MLSYWEQESFIKYDVAIIGAGITGLSTAIELKEKKPDLSVIVLEKGLLPTGASTKNAGFACVGSLTEILDDLKSMTPDEVVKLVRMRKDGLELLRKRLGDSVIDYEENGSYELCLNNKDYRLDIEKVNHLLLEVFKKPVFELTQKKFGFSKDVKTVIKSNVEGQLNTGKMMKGLLQYAAKVGVELKTGYEVKGIRNTSKSVEILHDSLILEAQKVCVCTNAFSQRFIENEDIQPGRGQVLITKPIQNLLFKGVFHFNEGYYYFRNVGKRVLFGGGRQLDFEKEKTINFESNQTILNDLIEKLENMILPNTPFEIDETWTGIMAFGDTKMPIIKQFQKRIFGAIRFGGMGVAIGSKAGELIANKILDTDHNHK